MKGNVNIGRIFIGGPQNQISNIYADEARQKAGLTESPTSHTLHSEYERILQAGVTGCSDTPRTCLVGVICMLSYFI